MGDTEIEEARYFWNDVAEEGPPLFGGVQAAEEI